MSTDLHGVVPILITPFDADQNVDLAALERVVDYALTCGVHAVALPAFGSEYYKLSEDERLGVVEAAARRVAGRVPVVGMANHGSSHQAARLARDMADRGADIIGINLPRSFAVSEDDLLRFVTPIAEAAEVPLLVQDWNPGGGTVGAEFCVKLHQRCPNFRFIKLEEPMMGPKMKAIHEATEHKVGVLEGWGGLFLLELVPYGCVGSMPGLAVVDALVRIWNQVSAGNAAGAFGLFAEVMPYIYFSLESFEVYHHLEKRLLVERGVLTSPQVRDLTTRPDACSEAYFAYLQERLWDTLQRHGLPKCPLA